MGAVSAVFSAIAGVAKAVGAYLGLLHDREVKATGETEHLAKDQAEVIKGDADARKIEARVAADDDPAQLERLRQQRAALTGRR